jgi:hypothetical protein
MTKAYRPNPEGTLDPGSELLCLNCLRSPCTSLASLAESYRSYTVRLIVVVRAEIASFAGFHCADVPVNFVTILLEV